MYIKVLKITITTLLMFASLVQACEISMGYRTTARAPKIAASPDDSGLFRDLYSRAAEMAGCELKIVRSTKKRILQGMIDGDVDFYPGFSITKKRAKYAYYAENGLISKEIGITRTGESPVKSYQDLAGKIVLVAYGSPASPAEKHGALIKTPAELDFPKIIELLVSKQADFYHNGIGTLSYLLKDHPQRDKIKIHMNCCGKVRQNTLGFSKKSVHFSEEINSSYSETKPLSVLNQPIKTSSSSVAARFFAALSTLEREGFTSKLYAKHYGVSFTGLNSTNQH